MRSRKHIEREYKELENERCEIFHIFETMERLYEIAITRNNELRFALIDEFGALGVTGGDGEKIRCGDIVYGEDGKAWYVSRLTIDNRSHPVVALPVDAESKCICATSSYKLLRPKWLSHTPPEVDA